MITAADATEYETHEFTMFASDHEDTCKGWPERLETNLGNGRPFLRVSKKVENGDLLWVTYVQSFGCIRLRIFND